MVEWWGRVEGSWSQQKILVILKLKKQRRADLLDMGILSWLYSEAIVFGSRKG